MARRTWYNPNGNWGVKGLDWNQLDVLDKFTWDTIYGCLWKLKDYEDVNPDPNQLEDELDRLREEQEERKT